MFVFGPLGDPMWTPWPPTAHELELFRLGLVLLEQHEGRPAPLSVKGMSGLYTAIVLDAERTLMAVVIHKPRPKKPAEDRGVPEVSAGRTSGRGRPSP